MGTFIFQNFWIYNVNEALLARQQNTGPTLKHAMERLAPWLCSHGHLGVLEPLHLFWLWSRGATRKNIYFFFRIFRKIDCGAVEQLNIMSIISHTLSINLTVEPRGHSLWFFCHFQRIERFWPQSWGDAGSSVNILIQWALYSIIAVLYCVNYNNCYMFVIPDICQRSV